MADNLVGVPQPLRAHPVDDTRTDDENAGAAAEPGTEAELLGRMLCLLYAPVRASQLAASLLSTFRSLDQVMQASSQDLSRVPGLDPRAAQLLQCQAKMTELIALRRAAPLPRFGRLAELRAYMLPRMAHLPVETMRVVLLDASNHLIGEEELARGTVNGVTVYAREVARVALIRRATAVVIAHNHPSGDPHPSAADVELTYKLHVGLAALGIALEDHLVIGRNEVFSFRETGMLPGRPHGPTRRIGEYAA